MLPSHVFNKWCGNSFSFAIKYLKTGALCFANTANQKADETKDVTKVARESTDLDSGRVNITFLESLP